MQGNTSWLGRYLSQKALRAQSRNDNASVPLKSIPTTALQAIPPLSIPAYMANEMVMNQVVQGSDPTKAKRVLDKAMHGVSERSWGDQLLNGLKKSPTWALGGGAASGLAGYLVSKYLNKDTDPMAVALKSGLVGGGVSSTIPLAQAALSKIVLDRATSKDKRKARDFLSEHPNKASLPLGDMVGAAVTK